jgi:signal transduction histidine kinase
MAASLGRVPSAAFGPGGPALRRRGCWWRVRDWRLRTKLTAVLLVPLLLAGMLGTLRVTELVRRAQQFAALARQVELAQQVGTVVHELQAERQRVAAVLASAGRLDQAMLQPQFQRVDAAAGALRAASVDSAAQPPDGREQLLAAQRAAFSQLSRLTSMRQVSSRPTPAPLGTTGSTARIAIADYSTLIATLLDLDRRVLDTLPEPLNRQANAVKALALAKEQASWEHAMLLAAIYAGGLPADQQALLRTADARFDAEADEFAEVASPAQLQRYFGTRAVLDRKRLLDTALERSMRAAPLDTLPDDWNSAAAGTVESIRQGEINLLNELRAGALARSEQAKREAMASAAAVAVPLLLAVLLLAVVVRSLVQQLRTLRTAAFEVADRRLPEVMERFRAADCAPEHTEVDPVPVHTKEEVGQLARAFDTVHVQAVRLAAEQARLRNSLNEIFLNLSGRSQGLVEQQLRVIEELRSWVPDPAARARLSELDRLATRLRRHSENVLVLAGGEVRRAGAQPVGVQDVFQRTTMEIEAPERVVVSPVPAAMVAGPVANDLVHLLAELLDNATRLSAQGTMVGLSGTLAEDGSLQVEVTDSGPGLPPQELAQINARLAAEPAVDTWVPGQLGLFVVSGLAAQHGIAVQLQPRRGEPGITATVRLPPSLVTIDLRAPGPVAAGAPAVATASVGEVPVQVSVIDRTAPPDLFSPASPDVGPAPRPRTAQEEWFELFGQLEPHSEQAPVGGSQRRDAPGGQPQVREEIYEAVSAWFRERQSALVSTTPEWHSPFDEGWQAAQALSAPADHELTRAGLPRRQPRAHLVSGGDGTASGEPPATGPARTPDAVRGRLSRYQRGLQVGRHARISPDDTVELPTWADAVQKLSGEETPQ